MAAKTDPINTSNPAGNSDPKQGDDHIRTLARAVLELLTVDHYIGVANPWGSESSGDETGEHAKVTLHAPIADPSNVANKGHLYIKDVNSKAELHFQDEDGDAIQLTSGGEVLFGSLSSIGKDTYLKAIDNAGTGTIDLIKGNASDKAVVKAGAELSTSGDPTTAAGIACKEWVEGQVASAISGIDSIFGDSTGDDSESNAFEKAHAYSAPTDGIVTAWSTAGNSIDLKGYVGATTNPAGAGTLEGYATNYQGEGNFISFPVPKGKYWEITCNGTLVGVRWRAIGTLSKPVDNN